MVQAASAHPRTRWCVTLIDDQTGTATAHGCAPGQHPWTPPARDPSRHRTGGDRDGPGDPGDGQTAEVQPDPGQVAQQTAEFLTRLQVKLAPIAHGADGCDHRYDTDAYEVPKKLKHLVKARRATCIAACCNRPGADHTIPWPEGPTFQHNLGAPCRHHHRCKQAPGWFLEQPEPGVSAGPAHPAEPTKPGPPDTSSSV
jgi:hypothetical protein